MKLKRPCIELSISVICIGGLSGRTCLGKTRLRRGARFLAVAACNGRVSVACLAGCPQRPPLFLPDCHNRRQTGGKPDYIPQINCEP